MSHQFISNEAVFESGISIAQESNYPWEGTITYHINNSNSESTCLGIRVPEWSQTKSKLVINNEQKAINLKDGFVYLDIPQGATEVQLSLDMSTKLYQANQKVVYDFNKVAVQRGPLLYCVEEIDQKESVWKYRLKPQGRSYYTYDPKFLGGVGIVCADAQFPAYDDQPSLYKEYQPLKWKDTQIKLVPYYAWANRGDNQMEVWIDCNE